MSSLRPAALAATLAVTAMVAALFATLMLPAAPVLAAHDPFAAPGHMTMTPVRPAQPGDKQRADAIVAAARKAAEPYRDYHKAFEDGYSIFHPEIPQPVYHFTDNAHALYNTTHFDPSRPTSLLYERTPPAHRGEKAGYKLVGVMYTAPFRDTPEQLDALVPLSVGRWHLHTNLCIPPEDEPDRASMAKPDSKFGLQGSITTQVACDAAGGTFMSHLFGWMIHVYPFENDPAKVWASGMGDEHGMQHDTMPAGMPM
jgi:hypothetical protein